MNSSANISPCRRYRYTLTRHWDRRPTLLVCMFNPSRADADIDDPTISLLCHIAAHNGYGGIVVVNAIPLRSPTPADAVDMVSNVDTKRASHNYSHLALNLEVVREEVAKANAVLLAWGGVGKRCKTHMQSFIEEIQTAVAGRAVPIYCLGKTADRHPKHPMARGRYKVPKTAALLPWDAT